MGWAEVLAALGITGDIVGNIFGAQSTNQANAANLAAQQARTQQVEAYMRQFLQPNQNPYASALNSFIGLQGMQAGQAQLPAPYNPSGLDLGFTAPGGVNGTDHGSQQQQPVVFGPGGVPVNPNPVLTPPVGPGGSGPITGTGVTTGIGLGGGSGVQGSGTGNLMAASGQYAGMDLNTLLGNPLASQAPALPGSYQAGAQPTVNDLGVTVWPGDSTYYGQVDPRQGPTYDEAGQLITPAGAQWSQNPVDAAFQNPQTGMTPWDSSMQTLTPSGVAADSFTASGTDGIVANDALTRSRDTSSLGITGVGALAPITTTGNPRGRDTSGLGLVGPQQLSLPGVPQGSPGSIDQGMYRYQPQQAYTSAGFAPLSVEHILAPQTGAPSQVSSQPISLTGRSGSQGGGMFQLPGGGTQGNNTGQDGMMQGLQQLGAGAGFGGNRSGGLDRQLGQQLMQIGQGGATQFDNSAQFQALAAQDAQREQQQVSALHGSAGSLGQRFGTAMNQNEALLRGTLSNDIGVRNAGIASASYEADQARRLQALGLGTTFSQQQGAQGLQAQQLASQNAQFNSSQNLQAQLANQSAGMQTGQYNATNQLQGLLANQASGLQAGTTNLQTLLQNQQFNAGSLTNNSQFAANQGNIYNQTMLNAFGQGNSLQQGNVGANTSLLSLLAGLPIGQQQPNAYPAALSDSSQMLALFPALANLYK